MASTVESMPPPLAFPHQSPSPAPDQSTFRPSSRSGNNSHPYAIVTSSSALLTRTNSTGHGKSKVSHSYTPASPSSPSKIITNPHNRTHRHTRSMSSVVPPPPLPIPPSPSTPSRMADHWGNGNVSDGGIPRPRRSETMPVFPNSPTKETDPEIKIADLPDNPKLWTPMQLSVYLASALRVKGSDKLPAPVAKDIAAFIIKERIAGRVFLRLTEEDLEDKGINRLWRNALLSAARSLRKKVLKGRIWGFGGPPAPETQLRRPSTVPEGAEHEVESAEGETPDKPPRGGYRRGRVRGMVESLERSSSSASSGSSTGRRSPIELDMDDLPGIDTNDEAIRNELRAAGLWDSDSQDEDAGFASGEQESPMTSEPAFAFPPVGDNADKPVEGEATSSDAEPTMEELLKNEPNGPTWGARAWELDEDLVGAGTARRVVETIQPSSRKGSSKRLKNSRPPTIKGVPLAGVFGDSEAATESVPAVSLPSLPRPQQQGPTASELIEAFKIRLGEIERRLAEMEKKDEERDRQRAQELERQQALAEAARNAAHESPAETQGNTMGSLPSSPSLTSMMLGLVFPKLADRLGTRSPSLSPRPSVQDIPSDVQPHPTKRKRVQNDQISDLTPAALPQYVLLVGLGVCAVILRVLLRRVSGRR